MGGGCCCMLGGAMPGRIMPMPGGGIMPMPGGGIIPGCICMPWGG